MNLIKQSIVITLLFFLGELSFVKAQAVEPCIRYQAALSQDSISWTNSTCPNFGGYVIFVREVGTSSFTVLDTLFQQYFLNPNLNNANREYQIGLLCGGLIQDYSAIVSNAQPITPDLLSVDIINGFAEVSWEASPSPEVLAYEVYKERPYGSGNFFPYSGVVTGLSYRDPNNSDLPARYAIKALSACNQSILGEGDVLDATTGPHTTMLLSEEIDVCTQSVKLTWNAYENWEFGVEAYEVWLSIDGALATKVVSLPATKLSYTYTDGQDDQQLNFFIRAVEKGKNNVALSNKVDFLLEVNRAMDKLYITELSVLPSNEIQLQWIWDVDVDFLAAKIQRQTAGASWEDIQTLSVPTQVQEDYIDGTAAGQKQHYGYRVVSEDICANRVVSNQVESILLKGEAGQDYRSRLTWKLPNIQYGQLKTLSLYRVKAGKEDLLTQLPIATEEYTDVIDVLDDREAKLCYTLKANYDLILPSGEVVTFQNTSNYLCVQQGSSIFVPNAFAPNGENCFFRPKFIFENTIESYTLQVYSRMGNLVYETAEIRPGWDGRSSTEQPLPQGVYTFVIRYKEKGTAYKEERGTVLLLR